jgi:hypothetical protein
VLEDHLVTSAFVSVLTSEFVQRGHGSVELETIKQQIFTIVDVSGGPDARDRVTPVMGMLVQRLTRAEAPVFRRDGNRLTLTQTAISEPSVVREALRNLEPGQEAPPSAPEGAPVSQEDVLSAYFEGFEREIMRARLGDEGSSERG